MFKMPEGVSFFEWKKGIKRIAVVPYKVGKGNPFADEGEMGYELTFWSYRRIGVDEKPYVAPAKTFGAPDPVAEYVREQSRNPKADSDYLKSLAAKERQMFLVYDLDEPEKGLQLLELSFHAFGKLLDERVRTGDEELNWDFFYLPDERGQNLRVTIGEDSVGKGTFVKATAIDFTPRKSPLPDKIVNHGIVLEDLLIHVEYDKLKAIFLGAAPGASVKKEQETKDEDEAPAKKERKADEKPASNEESKPETKPATKLLTAEEAGLKLRDDVIYNKAPYSILKISPDGTSLMLVDDDGNIEKAIAVDEVKKLKAAPKPEPKEDVPFDDDEKPAPKAEKKEPVAAAKGKGDDDDSWDAEWDA